MLATVSVLIFILRDDRAQPAQLAFKVHDADAQPAVLLLGLQSQLDLLGKVLILFGYARLKPLDAIGQSRDERNIGAQLCSVARPGQQKIYCLHTHRPGE